MFRPTRRAIKLARNFISKNEQQQWGFINRSNRNTLQELVIGLMYLSLEIEILAVYTGKAFAEMALRNLEYKELLDWAESRIPN